MNGTSKKHATHSIVNDDALRPTRLVRRFTVCMPPQQTTQYAAPYTASPHHTCIPYPNLNRHCLTHELVWTKACPHRCHKAALFSIKTSPRACARPPRHPRHVSSKPVGWEQPRLHTYRHVHDWLPLLTAGVATGHTLVPSGGHAAQVEAEATAGAAGVLV
eukprot:7183620-Prymnesium_polylepis.1